MGLTHGRAEKTGDIPGRLMTGSYMIPGNVVDDMAEEQWPEGQSQGLPATGPAPDILKVPWYPILVHLVL